MNVAVTNPGRLRFPAASWIPLLVIGLLAATAVSVPPLWIAAGVGAVAALVALGYVAYSCLQGTVSWILLAWVPLFPLGYYFLSFPREHPLITFDRAVIAILFLGMCFATVWRGATPMEGNLRRSGIAWMLFLTAAAFSLLSPGVTLGSVRVYVEGFIVPALFAWYVVSFFSIHDRLRKLHVLTALMCLYCAPIGIAEIILGEDLMPLKDSGSFYAGTGVGEILRVNGPFQSNNSYALIGLVALFLLFFLRQAIGVEMPRWQRLLHFFGCVAAVVMTLLPMFRSVLLTLVAILFLHLWSTRSWQKRVIFMMVFGVVCCSFLVLNAVMPDLYEERVSSMDNVAARFAQQEQNIDMFLRHPILGVGIGNFLNVVRPVTKYSSLNPHGIDPLDAPHNNLAAVLVETGIVGFACYFLAQIFLIAAFWRFRKSAVVGARISWVFFLYVYLCYWISGMTLTSGHYGDLNIWYLFVLAVIYKYGIEEERKHPMEIAYAS